MKPRPGQLVRSGLLAICISIGIVGQALAAPYAAMVMDARTGEILHARNADTRLHPASLTKMMTLYIAFQAVKAGEITMDTRVTISKKAAAEPPSKLGLKPGQRIALRYLVRAAAVRSANDAATAIGEAISGSEAAFAQRMNRTAKAIGMNNTNFKNAHGLTQSGHLSTARDMTIMGRHLFYDHPEYYNLFSRRTADAGVATVAHTNRRFLADYEGADGIKTGYTRAAGFNLVASAKRGNERIIATMFGGQSTAQRNARVAELLDMGFKRAPSNARVRRPDAPPVMAVEPSAPPPVASNDTAPPAGKTIRVVRAVAVSPFPRPRPVTPSQSVPDEMLVAMAETINEAVIAAQVNPAPVVNTDLANVPKPVLRPDVPKELIATLEDSAPLPEASPEPLTETTVQTASLVTIVPAARPSSLDVVDLPPSTIPPEPERERIVVTRLSTSGGRHWGINVGRFASQGQAERVLLKMALAELDTLDTALRKVARHRQGFDANFVGMTKEGAAQACRRLAARNVSCKTLGPA